MTAGTGAKHRYGLVIIALLALLHFYALLSMRSILGRLHMRESALSHVGLFSSCGPAALATGGIIGVCCSGRRGANWAWMPAVTSCLIASVAVFGWFQWILAASACVYPDADRLVLPRSLTCRSSKGPIIDYLQQHIGLKPGSEFRGYATTFLGAPDALVRKVDWHSDRTGDL